MFFKALHLLEMKQFSNSGFRDYSDQNDHGIVNVKKMPKLLLNSFGIGGCGIWNIPARPLNVYMCVYIVNKSGPRTEPCGTP